MSEAVERRIVALLERPLVCPHGSPIPGLDELGVTPGDAESGRLVTLTTAAVTAGPVEVERIGEILQPDAELLHRLSEAGMRPGHKINVAASQDGVEVWHDDGPRTIFSRDITDYVFVRVA